MVYLEVKALSGFGGWTGVSVADCPIEIEAIWVLPCQDNKAGHDFGRSDAIYGDYILFPKGG